MNIFAKKGDGEEAKQQKKPSNFDTAEKKGEKKNPVRASNEPEGNFCCTGEEECCWNKLNRNRKLNKASKVGRPK